MDAVQRLVDCQMCHCRLWSRAMPMLFAGWKVYDVTRFHLADRTTPSLRQACPGNDLQRLAERMRVPRRASARFEAHQRGTHPCGRFRLDNRLLQHTACEVSLGWSDCLNAAAGENLHLIKMERPFSQ